ncbi:hypothetical protein ADUPG1_012216, partial [Aduncisulcus paluster]
MVFPWSSPKITSPLQGRGGKTLMSFLSPKEIEELYTAQFHRRSRRGTTYDAERPLTPEDLRILNQFAKRLTSEYVGANIIIVTGNKDIATMFKLGFFSFAKNPVGCVIFNYDEKKISLENASFCFELFILKCTAMKLATCWMAG